MKKNLGIIIVILGLMALMFSYVDWKKNIEQTGDRAYAAYTETIMQQEKEEQDLLDSLNPELNPNQNMQDYLRYKSLINSRVAIALIGSSVTQGAGSSEPHKSWGNLLADYLKDSSAEINRVSVANHGFGGYSTVSLVKEKKIEGVIQDSPDLVIFETSILNNHGQSVSLEETKANINEIVTSVKENLPNAKLLLISPNPASAKLGVNQENDLGLTYEDYVIETGKFIKENGWNYFDTYSHINARVKQEQLDLKKLLADGIHPNDDGYRMWAEELYSYIAK